MNGDDDDVDDERRNENLIHWSEITGATENETETEGGLDWKESLGVAFKNSIHCYSPESEIIQDNFQFK